MIFLKTYEIFSSEFKDMNKYNQIRPRYNKYDVPPGSEKWKIGDVVIWNMNDNFYNAWLKTFNKCIIKDIDKHDNIKVLNTKTGIEVNVYLPKYYFMSKDEYEKMIDIVDNTNKYNL